MDVEYVNPFITSVRELFDRMVCLPLTVGRPNLRPRGSVPSKLHAISFNVFLDGAVRGNVVINFPAAVAIEMAEKLSGSTFADLMNPDCLDAVKEVANMIVGGAKKLMPGGLTKMTLPRLVNSSDVSFPTDTPVLTIPCETSSGRFTIETNLRDMPREATTPEPEIAA